jgi:osmoprotectant transport system ATP-binding protein
MRVESVMSPLAQPVALNGAPTISATDDLRTALSMLLLTGAPTLVVLAQDQPVGTLSLEQIRESAVVQERARRRTASS